MVRVVAMSDALAGRAGYLRGAVLVALFGTAAGYALAATPRDGVYVLQACTLGSLLIALSLVDMSTYRLPNPLTMALGLTGLAATWSTAHLELVERAIAMLIGWGVMTVIAVAYLRIRGREGLGLGDAKLVGASGAWVGIDGLASVVLLGSCLALVAIAIATTGGRPHRPDARLAFGPYLALGIWLVWLFGPVA